MLKLTLWPQQWPPKAASGLSGHFLWSYVLPHKKLHKLVLVSPL